MAGVMSFRKDGFGHLKRVLWHILLLDRRFAHIGYWFPHNHYVGVRVSTYS